MSDLLVENHVLLPIAVVTAGFLGSLHCAGMCGPLILSVARDRKTLVAYHAGRLASYTLAGAASGAFGHLIFSHAPVWLTGVFLALFAGLLILSGIRQLRLQPLHSQSGWIAKILGPFQKRAFALRQKQPLIGTAFLGFLSVLLPCGHLYAYLGAAAATGSGAGGALLMSLFAVSTWPALGFGLHLMQRLLAPAARLRLAGCLFLIAGAMSFSGFLIPWLQGVKSSAPASVETAAPRCH